jgi:hypothetical protein
MPRVAQTGSPESHASVTPKPRSTMAWAAGLGMGLLAVAGWSAFAHGVADQQRLRAERDRLSAEAADLRASREQLAGVYVKALAQLASAQTQLAATQNELAMVRSRSASLPPAGTPPPAISATRTPPAPVPSPNKARAASAGGRVGAPPPIPPYLRVFLPPSPRA